MTCSVSGWKRYVHKGQKNPHVLEHSEACQTALSFYCVAASNKIVLPGDHNSNGYRYICKLVADGESLPWGVLAARLEAQPARVHRLNDDTPPVFPPHHSTTSHTAPCCGLNTTWGSGTPYKSMHEVGDCVLWHYPLSLFVHPWFLFGAPS